MPQPFNITNKYAAIATGLLIVLVLGAYSYNGEAGKPASLTNTDTVKWPASFGFGKTATPQQIATQDIDVRPDGLGLPVGSGTVAQGKAIYALKCIACHGSAEKVVAGAKLPAPVLVSDSASKVKAIGNYWPYASTVFDYIRRSMPYNLPGSLTNNEVYDLTAYLLNANKIIKPDAVLNAQTLPKVVMPAQKLFITDDRKDGPEIR
ncbi:c-type cytochrome [Mucilaginibacter aquaedulcis]|uniref:c-type cytochrome n=1 Tax=Mucilaginibacter aquaedulcis TaxID=1187081 RepID=UPI0025B4BDA6|nr:cytochrome c [Mucilaginibacter aquaedulcis]MDN3547653.1 cytochrome c [Mucilaginibacter aquaedulcis]